MIIANVLHLVGAVFVLGPLVVLPMVGLNALRSGNGAAAAHIATLVTVLTYASLAVALAGFALMGMGAAEEGWSFSTPWILTSAILYTLSFVGMAAIVAPQLKAASCRVADAQNGSGPGSYRLLASSSGVVALLLVAVVVLMVAQPGS